MSTTHEAPTYQSSGQSMAPAGATAGSDARGAAMAFLGSLAAELSSGTVDLPCFPDVVIRIRQALDNPDIKPEKAVTVVGAEPRLAAKVIQTANSAAFNASGKPVTELRTAITRLGHQTVQSVAMAFAVKQMKDASSLRSIAEPLAQLWNDSIAVASIAQKIARRTDVSHEEAFLTGLLHGIGQLYIMVRSVDQGPVYLENASFRELVTGWHPSIGKAIMENWEFAPHMADAIGHQGDDESRRNHKPDLTDVLGMAIFLADALKSPPPRQIEVASVPASVPLGLTEADCTAILTHAEYQIGSLLEVLGC